MSRRMSCALTMDAVRARTKTVTRRHPDTWKTLAVGDRLTLVEKAMGLPKGARQIILAEVEIVDVRVEPLSRVLTEDFATIREGLPLMLRGDFIRFWLSTHGYQPKSPLTDADLDTPCRRIEWRYLPAES